jgi:hypothetical protein
MPARGDGDIVFVTSIEGRKHAPRVDREPPLIAGSKTAPANRVSAIRPKIRFWRALTRRLGLNHKNFFIAKVGDSESTPAPFER